MRELDDVTEAIAVQTSAAHTLREGLRRIVNERSPAASPRLRVNRQMNDAGDDAPERQVNGIRSKPI
jgi:hypothetical protein